MNFIRTWGPIGRILRDVPSHVPQQQKFFAARADIPTHLKRASDPQVFYVVGGIMTVGGVLFVKGAVDLLTGTNKRAA